MLSSEDLIGKVVQGLDSIASTCTLMGDSLETLKKPVTNAKSEANWLAKRNGVLEIEATNTRKLADMLQQLTQALSVSDKAVESLTLGDWTDPDAASDCVSACEELSKALSADVEEQLADSRAVTEQLRELQKHKALFTQRLHRQLDSALVGVDTSAASRKAKSGKVATSLMEFHIAIRQFSDVINAAHLLDSDSGSMIRGLYITHVKAVLQSAVSKRIDAVQSSTKARSETTKLMSLPDAPWAPVALPVEPLVDETKAAGDLCADVCKTMSSELAFAQRCMCLGAHDDPESVEFVESIFGDISSVLYNVCLSEARSDTGLFVTMLCELEALVEEYSPHCAAAEALLVQLQIKIKWSLHQYVEEQVKVVQAVGGSIKQSGLCAPVKKLPTLIRLLEAHIVRERAAPLEAVLAKLAKAVVDQVHSLAATDQKYKAVFTMENCWFLFRHLSTSRNEGLETIAHSLRTTASQQQTEYCEWIVACQFADVQDFFRTVDNLMATMPAADVQFQTACSRHSMRKVAKSFHQQLFEKRVESMHARMHKHLCAPLRMSGSVWAQLEEIVFGLVTRFQQLLTDCYGGENAGVHGDIVSKVFTHFRSKSGDDAMSYTSETPSSISENTDLSETR